MKGLQDSVVLICVLNKKGRGNMSRIEKSQELIEDMSYQAILDYKKGLHVDSNYVIHSTWERYINTLFAE